MDNKENVESAKDPLLESALDILTTEQSKKTSPHPDTLPEQGAEGEDVDTDMYVDIGLMADLLPDGGDDISVVSEPDLLLDESLVAELDVPVVQVDSSLIDEDDDFFDLDDIFEPGAVDTDQAVSPDAKTVVDKSKKETPLTEDVLLPDFPEELPETENEVPSLVPVKDDTLNATHIDDEVLLADTDNASFELPDEQGGDVDDLLDEMADDLPSVEGKIDLPLDGGDSSIESGIENDFDNDLLDEMLPSEIESDLLDDMVVDDSLPSIEPAGVPLELEDAANDFDLFNEDEDNLPDNSHAEATSSVESDVLSDDDFDPLDEPAVPLSAVDDVDDFLPELDVDIEGIDPIDELLGSDDTDEDADLFDELLSGEPDVDDIDENIDDIENEGELDDWSAGIPTTFDDEGELGTEDSSLSDDFANAFQESDVEDTTDNIDAPSYLSDADSATNLLDSFGGNIEPNINEVEMTPTISPSISEDPAEVMEAVEPPVSDQTVETQNDSLLNEQKDVPVTNEPLQTPAQAAAQTDTSTQNVKKEKPPRAGLGALGLTLIVLLSTGGGFAGSVAMQKYMPVAPLTQNDGLSERMNSLEGKVVKVNTKVNQQVTAMEKGHAKLLASYAELTKKQTALSAAQQEQLLLSNTLKSSADSYEGEMVSRFETLLKYTQSVSQKQDSQSAEIKEDVYKKALAALEKRTSGDGSDMLSLKKQISTSLKRVNKLEAEVAAQKSLVSMIEGESEYTKARIQKVEQTQKKTGSRSATYPNNSSDKKDSFNVKPQKNALLNNNAASDDEWCCLYVDPGKEQVDNKTQKTPDKKTLVRYLLIGVHEKRRDTWEIYVQPENTTDPSTFSTYRLSRSENSEIPGYGKILAVEKLGNTDRAVPYRIRTENGEILSRRRQ